MKDRPFEQPSFEGLPREFFVPQNLPSFLAVKVLNPQPGERILDMCASPGGKTGHIASCMNNVGCLVAVDKSSKKVARLEAHLSELGVTCAHLLAQDATRLGIEQKFDRILLDGPCSGLGQRPLLPGDADRPLGDCDYASYQKKLFKRAWELLRPGGTMVYSTCTIDRRENEDVVAWATESLHDLQLVDTGAPYGSPGIKGPLTGDQASKVRRFGPGSEENVFNDTIAFFIAKFFKT